MIFFLGSCSGITSADHLLSAESETNQVFPILPNSVISTMQRDFEFYAREKQGPDSSVIRLITSWATEERHVEAFLSKLPPA